MRVDSANRNMINEMYVIYTSFILVVLIVLVCFILYITDTDSENDTFGNYGTTYYTLRHTINTPKPSSSFVSLENSLNEQKQQNEETSKNLQNTTEKVNRRYIRHNKKRYANSIEGLVNIV